MRQEPKGTVPFGDPTPHAPSSTPPSRTIALYPPEPPLRVPFSLAPARTEVFSYSSALASHAGPPPKAERDAAAEGAAYTDDADKATNLGSAFHALAQTMVERGLAHDHDPARLQALARTWHLSARQVARLERAIACWEASDVRQEALGYALQRAEVPFFAQVEGTAYEQYGRYVEGAIDLLCTEGPRCAGHALVVDYKTGDLGLSEDEVRARHNAQAQLYAHVLLGQGFSSVSCAFVCVETGVVARWCAKGDSPQWLDTV